MEQKKEATSNSLTIAKSLKMDKVLKDTLTAKAKAGGITLSNAIELYLKYGLKQAGKKTLLTINKELWQ